MKQNPWDLYAIAAVAAGPLIATGACCEIARPITPDAPHCPPPGGDRP
ncbi:hypothetical protein [Streptomyces sp. NPDC051909]